MEYNEFFKNELLAKMTPFVSKSALTILDQTVVELLDGYRIQPTKNELMAMGDYNEVILNHYLRLSNLSGLSENTLKQYENSIRQMLLYINKDVRDITTNDVRRFLNAYKNTNNVSDVTLDNKRRFLCSFFSWLNTEEYIKTNPMDKIKAIKCEKKVKTAYTYDEMNAIRSACESLRERALIEFLYGTGCRVSEVANVKVCDFNAKDGECLVTKGKGNKQRIVFPSDASISYITDYLNTRGRLTDNDYLLVNSYGKPMTKETIENTVKRIGERAGVKKCHPHKFRRTYITNGLDCGVPIQSISRAVGHSKIDTTMIYCASSNETIKEDLKKIV